MRIHEVQLTEEMAARLGAWAKDGSSAVLLGREFGGAVVLTGAVPVPGDEAGWEDLRCLRHGPVGLLGSPPPSEERGRLLPGDILLDVSAGMSHTDWEVHTLDWTGPGKEHRLKTVPLRVEGT